ncbi:hypothetical protein FRC17_003188, partial [Serendipita sp. 399]
MSHNQSQNTAPAHFPSSEQPQAPMFHSGEPQEQAHRVSFFRSFFRLGSPKKDAKLKETKNPWLVPPSQNKALLKFATKAVQSRNNKYTNPSRNGHNSNNNNDDFVMRGFAFETSPDSTSGSHHQAHCGPDHHHQSHHHHTHGNTSYHHSSSGGYDWGSSSGGYSGGSSSGGGGDSGGGSSSSGGGGG